MAKGASKSADASEARDAVDPRFPDVRACTVPVHPCARVMRNGKPIAVEAHLAVCLLLDPLVFPSIAIYPVSVGYQLPH